MPIISFTGPTLGVWNFLKTRLGSDRENAEFRAQSELLDGLRHADKESDKYLITLYMKSGRTLIGRMGSGDYLHESYDKHRGTLTVFLERDYPAGVSYEQCLIRMSEVEGYLLQQVSHASPLEIRRLQESADFGEAPPNPT